MTSDLFFPPRSFAGLPPELTALDTARAVVLPVPYDSTTDYKSGARDGPRAIIDSSQYLEFYDLELGQEVSSVGIHTLPELQPAMSGPEATVERVYRAARGIFERGKLLVMLGGEHSLTLGAVKAAKERYPNLGVLQLDAHADLRDTYMATEYSHACVMRRVWELCPIVQVGIRSLSLEEHRFLEEQGVEPLYAPLPEADVTEKVVSALPDEVYISVDLDVFDPSIMAAVGTPEPGGLGWEQALHLLKAAASTRHIVGLDLMELCPREGPTSCAFLAAKLAYKLIGYALLL